MKKAGSTWNRKVLAEIAFQDPEGFPRRSSRPPSASRRRLGRERGSGNRPEAGGAGRRRPPEPGLRGGPAVSSAAELSGSCSRREPRGRFLPADVAALKVRWLGKKQGVATALLARSRRGAGEEKSAFGAGVNALKQEVEARLDALEAEATARAAASPRRRKPSTSRSRRASLPSGASTR
ncbi:MAG: hypothetical protein IPP07_29335 [Holophagales bacterium]|nr:hypothetical protein [Holophagales bacterium]